MNSGVELTLDSLDLKDTRRQVESGVASTVDRARIKYTPADTTDVENEGGAEQGDVDVYVAIKAAAGRKRFSPEPHDILKEIAILSLLEHANVRRVH